MTVINSNPRNQYIANGAQTVFSYTFEITAITDIAVYVNENLQTLTTNYTVSGAGSDSGGTITFNIPPFNNDIVTIVSVIPYQRTVDFQTAGPLFAADLNRDADRITLGQQRLQEQINRSLRLAPGSSYSGETLEVSEDATDRAGKLLGFDQAGNVSLTDPLRSTVTPVDLYSGSTIADLKALTDRPPTVLITGALTPGDGAGGLWLWEPADSRTPDDEQIVQCTTGSDGRYVRISTTDPTTYLFGADGSGGTDDKTALESMLAAQLAAPQIKSKGSVNVAELIPGPDTADFVPFLNRVFNSGAFEGQTLRFPRSRAWVSLNRPSGAELGPQSQYLQPPLYCTLEWDAGAVWDFSAWKESSTRTVTGITKASQGVVTYTGTNPSEGSWIRFGGPSSPNRIGGMVEVNDRTFYVYQLNTTAKTFKLKDLNGAVVNTSSFTTFTSGGTFGVISSPVVVRREGSYGTAIDVVGSVSKGVNSITVGSGQAAGLKIFDRVAICNTANLDTLLNAWTLADAYNTQAAARSEDLIVKEVVGNTIKFFTTTRDSYDSSGSPKIYPYLNEPEITLINPTVQGSDLLDDTRLFRFAQCRNIQIEGGRIENIGGQPIGIYSSMGGRINNVTIISKREDGLPGGGITIGNMTSNFLVTNNRTFGGPQMFMMTAAGGTEFGISRDITFAFNNTYSPFNGFSTHNTHECLKYYFNNVWSPRGAGIDIRAPNCELIGGVVQGGASAAVFLRIASNGLVIDGLNIRDCLAGVRLTDFSSTDDDVDPGNYIFRNLRIENCGGSGSTGAIGMQYAKIRNGQRPVLGSFQLLNSSITMSNNTHAIQLMGKWDSPIIDGVTVRAVPGTSPAGRAILLDAGGSSTFTGSGSGTNLTVTNFAGDPLAPGMVIAGTGIGASITIVSQSSGTIGGNGVYVTSSSTTASGDCTAEGGPGQGPSNPVIRMSQSATYALPFIQDTTGLITDEVFIEGMSTSRSVALASSTTLISRQAASGISAGRYTNTGATALVEVTLPAATGPNPTAPTFYQEFWFTVTNVKGFKIIAVDNDTIQVGAGSAGAAAGSITSVLHPTDAAIGSWVRIYSVTSTQWICEIDDAANWTVA